MRTVELLAPAGSYDAFLAARDAGADAVYAGGSLFGARAYADNFTQDKFLQMIDEAHLADMKVFLTLNTLLKEEELEDRLFPFLDPLYQAGLDAVLVQDFGVLTCLRDCFPDLPVHASTQMAVTGHAAFSLLKSYGVKRIVCAREMSLKEIRAVANTTDLEIEAFLHGAMCYSCSGQCLMSSLIGGRSGNRGRCAQPCRLPYSVNGGKPSYCMSLRDMNTLRELPELLLGGIDSLKIEGRMKHPDYVYTATRIYREHLDQCAGIDDPSRYRVDEEDAAILAELYTRSGSGSGYYFRRNGRQMLTIEKTGL